jgi:hypothetical protein
MELTRLRMEQQRRRQGDAPSLEVQALRHEVRSLRAQLAQARLAA